MNQNQNQKQDVRTKIAKALLTITICFSCFAMNGFYAYAGNYGEKIGNWVLDQIFWVALIAIVFALVICLIKKAWVTIPIIIVVGGIVMVFIIDPKLVAEIGQTIYNSVFR